mmetsp:Transcript_27715/g.79602  ORF Transcript_27715/g.79602 Transcript_27715/m.79602 type:complete len:204 (-) Transcript_27715:526-1137(-)
MHGIGALGNGGLDLLHRLGMLGSVAQLLCRLHSIHVVDAGKGAHCGITKLLCLVIVIVLHIHITQLQHRPALLGSVPRCLEHEHAVLAHLDGLAVQPSVHQHAHDSLQDHTLAAHIARLGEEILGLVQALRRLLDVSLFDHGGGVQAASLLRLVAEIAVDVSGLLDLLRSQEGLRWLLHEVRGLHGVVGLRHGALLPQLRKDG